MIGATGPNVSVATSAALRTHVVEHRRCQLRAVALPAVEQLRAVGDASWTRSSIAIAARSSITVPMSVSRIERVADLERRGAGRDALGKLVGNARRRR